MDVARLPDIVPVVAHLWPFDAICMMRKRMPMTRAIIERLPRLRLIASTAMRKASIETKFIRGVNDENDA